MGNPTDHRRSSTASFSPGHSRLQETSNHCAVIIQNICRARIPNSDPAEQIQRRVGFLLPRFD